MPNPKCHTAFQLFNGNGAPPSPFTTGSAGGGSAPTQVNGSLHFEGVGIGGSDSELEYSSPLDLTNDALFLQFESIIGQPGTVELDLSFSSSWSLTLQLRGLNWNVILMHGATVVQNKTETVDKVLVPSSPDSAFAYLIPNNEPLSWEVAYQTTDAILDTGTLEVMWGPTPQQMRAPYVILDLPNSVAKNLNDILLRSVNLESQSVTYGETRLIGFNAWSPAAAYVISANSGPLTGGTSFSGLTGHGTIALDDGTRAVRVNWTESFTALGFDVGAPNKFFEVGWVNFNNGTITERSQTIEFQDQVVAPLTPQNPSHLGYAFASPVTATITCLT